MRARRASWSSGELTSGRRARSVAAALVVLLVAAVGGVPVSGASWLDAPTAAADPGSAPPWGCPAEGILFQYPDNQNTNVFTIDMVSGDFTSPFTLDGVRINAIAHNPLDSYIYGWELDSDKLAQIASDGTVTLFDVPGVATSGRLTGDIDPNGHYWLTGAGGTGNWSQIDIATKTVLATGPIEGGGISNKASGADWAYVPGGGEALYRVMRNTAGNESFLFRFDLITHQHSNLGSLGNLGGNNSVGAVYSAPDGFLYASNNANGIIYRIDLTAVTATVFAPGPVSGSNDGARCFSAKIPVDFGDAPDSYGTSLANDGARHGIISYDRDASTSTLMMGARVDAETDGFPGPGADGDNLNNTDDEEGVVAPIVMVVGEPTEVSVVVTNNTGDPATLAGWIDLDGNGTFDAGERQVVTVAASTTGAHTLTFPAGTTTDGTYARFRLYPGEVADPSPVGPVAGGEVEDYPVLLSASKVTKTSDPASGTAVAPGDTVTYTLAVVNTGDVDVTTTITDDLSGVLDDATLASGPTIAPAGTGSATITGETLTWTGTLGPGATATITYAVTVGSTADRSDHRLTNAVTGAQCPTPAITDPEAVGFNADCVTVHPVTEHSAKYSIVKTSDPSTGFVTPGDTVTYTITVTNTGTTDLTPTVTDDLSEVIDDASYNNDAVASDGTTVAYNEPLLIWSGPLAAGAAVTVTYSVEVLAASEAGTEANGELLNAVSGDGPSNCPAPPITDPGAPGYTSDCVPRPLPVARVTPAPPVPPIPVAAPDTLPVTGATIVGLIGLGAGLLLTGSLLTGRVARSSQHRGRTSL